MGKPQSKPAYNPFAELAEIRDQKADHSGPEESERLGGQAPGRLVAKSQDPTFVKLTAYVPKQLHRAAKIRLLEQGREMSDLVEELVADWLKKQPARPE